MIQDPFSLENPDWHFIAWVVWVLINLSLFIFIKLKHPGAKASQKKALDFIYYDLIVFGSAILINVFLWLEYADNAYAIALWETLRFDMYVFPYLSLWVVLPAFFDDIYSTSRGTLDYRLHSLLFLAGLGSLIYAWNLIHGA